MTDVVRIWQEVSDITDNGGNYERIFKLCFVNVACYLPENALQLLIKIWTSNGNYLS